MGDKSPKANQKHKAQQQAKYQKRDSEERATGLSRQGRAEKEVDDAAKQQPWFIEQLKKQNA
jgi:hypothetical protein